MDIISEIQSALILARKQGRRVWISISQNELERVDSAARLHEKRTGVSIRHMTLSRGPTLFDKVVRIADHEDVFLLHDYDDDGD